MRKLVFLDLEAENIKTNRVKNHLLQLSAISFDEKGITNIFNEYCYYENNLSHRISNLLNKPINFFKNQKFLKESELIEKFFEFIKGYNVYSYGTFDQLVFEKTFSRIKMKNKKNQIN